jgi:hypothetical protein
MRISVHHFIVCTQGPESAWRVGQVTSIDGDAVTISWTTRDARGEAQQRDAIVSTHPRADLRENVASYGTHAAAASVLWRALRLARGEGAWTPSLNGPTHAPRIAPFVSGS